MLPMLKSILCRYVSSSVGKVGQNQISIGHLLKKYKIDPKSLYLVIYSLNSGI